MEERLKLATILLTESTAQIKTLKCQRDLLLKTVKEMQSTVLSRMDQQKLDISNLKRVFHDFYDQFQSLMSDVSTSFVAQTSNSSEVIKQLQYQNKCLRDQLSVRRIKYNNLIKRHETLVKKEAKVVRKKLPPPEKLQDNSKAVTRCLRCRARNNIIERLELDITECIGQKESSDKIIESLKSEKETLNENLFSVRRELVEVKQKWKEDVERLNLKSEPECSSCVEVSRTPSTQGAESPKTTDHSKCEKEIIGLQWSLSSKTAEILRLHNQVQEMKRESSGLSEDLKFYRNRSESLRTGLMELTATHVQLQAQLAESEQSRETLRTLLTNLATGVSIMFS